jgi:hypothetical protein
MRPVWPNWVWVLLGIALILLILLLVGHPVHIS